jgi:hypothetical protein
VVTEALPPLWYCETAKPDGTWTPRLLPEEPQTVETNGVLRLAALGGHQPRVRRVCRLPDHLRQPQRALRDLADAVALWLGEPVTPAPAPGPNPGRHP